MRAHLVANTRVVCVRARAGGTNATWRGEVNALPKAPSTRSNAKRTKWPCQSWYPHENHAPRRRAHTGEARGASRPPLCRPWPRRQHVGRRTHLAPSPPWPQSLTSRPTSRYPACLCAIRPLSGRSCKFSLWGQGGHRVLRWLSGRLYGSAEVSASCIRPPKCSRRARALLPAVLSRLHAHVSAAFRPPPATNSLAGVGGRASGLSAPESVAARACAGPRQAAAAREPHAGRTAAGRPLERQEEREEEGARAGRCVHADPAR